MYSSIPEIKASITASLCGFIQEWQEMIGQAAGVSKPAQSTDGLRSVPGDLLLIASELVAAVERSVVPPVAAAASGSGAGNVAAESGSATPPAPNPAWNRYAPNPAWRAGFSAARSETPDPGTQSLSGANAASTAVQQSPTSSPSGPAPALAKGVNA